MTSSVPFQSQQPVFGRVGNIAELVRMTPQELKQYNISIDTYRSNLAVMKNERREGYEEGMAIGEQRGIAIGEQRGIAIGEQRGIAIGEHNKATSIAIQLLSNGIGISVIAHATGLTEEEIKRLES